VESNAGEKSAKAGVLATAAPNSAVSIAIRIARIFRRADKTNLSTSQLPLI